MFLSTFKI